MGTEMEAGLPGQLGLLAAPPVELAFKSANVPAVTQAHGMVVVYAWDRTVKKGKRFSPSLHLPSFLVYAIFLMTVFCTFVEFSPNQLCQIVLHSPLNVILVLLPCLVTAFKTSSSAEGSI